MKQRILLFSMAGAMLHEKALNFASVKYGAIVTDIKGKVGGTIFSGSVAGGSMSNKAAVNKSVGSGGKQNKSSADKIISSQQNMADNATTYRNLSTAEQTAWTAAAPNFPFKNKFGEVYTASGYQVYMSINNNLKAIGQATLTTPPEATDLVPTPAFEIEMGGGASGDILLTMLVPDGYTLILYATASQSKGRSLEKGRLKAFTILGRGDYDGEIVTAAYVKVFGTIPPKGSIWFQAVIVKEYSGRQAVPFTIQVSFAP